MKLTNKNIYQTAMYLHFQSKLNYSFDAIRPEWIFITCGNSKFASAFTFLAYMLVLWVAHKALFSFQFVFKLNCERQTEINGRIGGPN